MRYGFVIDQDRCIGCHACTVACKDEHKVAVGVFRTWVKYIEKGSFPDTSRHFGVMRCNHCEQAPCIEICPTSALFKRDNGIVDFDNSRCIGCKSCMQACPYDALYIDPDTSTAAKCNFCAHRVEANLEPACVVVCPTQAIMTGDLDDPQSHVRARPTEPKAGRVARIAEPRMKPGALLATNTSSIMLEPLAERLAHPERLVGLHFFNPVAQMPLIEIVHAPRTDPIAVQAATGFARRLDKLPVPCRSAPGFMVNRVLTPYLYEAMLAAQEGTPLAVIDRCAVSFGMPVGPIELIDVVGLDVASHVGEIIAQGARAAGDGDGAPQRVARRQETRSQERRRFLPVAERARPSSHPPRLMTLPESHRSPGSRDGE